MLAAAGAGGLWRGLPAMALVRIIAPTFYARHDTATPVRATLIAMACNIALKFVFVWGFGLGVAGIALGTALGAWINVAVLTWIGKSRDLLAIESQFLRALAAALLAALAMRRRRLAGRASVARRRAMSRRWRRPSSAPALGYGAVLLLFRGRLPLGSRSVDVMRLFVALPIPDAVAQRLMLMQGGVPGARWQSREQLHLTLRFIGEVDGRDAARHRRCPGGDRCAGLRSATAWRRPVRQQAAACAMGGGAHESSCWTICSARWIPPSAASGSRRMRTNSRRMSPWRGCAIPIWTRCANG